MAIAYVDAGTVAAGTTSLSVPYPATVAAGNLLVLAICNKYPTNRPSTPTDWTAPSGNQYSGGAGSAGADTGTVYITYYVKIATGSETGNVSVTLTSANTCIGRIFRFSKAATATWAYACAGGSDNSAGTAWSVTAGSDPGVTANDLLIIASAMCGNPMTGSGYGLTQTGVTFGSITERQDSGTNNGDDCSLIVVTVPISSGTGSAAPVFTFTVGGTASATAAGASGILRMRELPAQTVTATAGIADTTGQNATVTPGAVTVQASVGIADTAGQSATISTTGGEQTVSATAGTADTAGQTATITPGAVTIQASAGVADTAGQNATVTPGAITVQATAGTSDTAGQSATVTPGSVSIAASAGTADSAGQNATVTPGSVSIAASAGSAASAGQSANISSGVPSITINATVGAMLAAGRTGTISSGSATIQAIIAALAMTGLQGWAYIPLAERIIADAARSKTGTAYDDRDVSAVAMGRNVAMGAQSRSTMAERGN